MLEEAAAAGVVGVTAGTLVVAAAGAVVGVTAGALVVAAAGAVVGVTVGAVAGAVPEAEDAGGGAVTVNAGAGGDVALALLADAVLGVDTLLAIRTPTPSAAPLSSVTRGMLTFMPSSTQSRRLPVRSHP
ncbi:MAG TPA: hypothetical protein VIX15_14130 [Streptosporangiaceae bacterium]